MRLVAARILILAAACACAGASAQGLAPEDRREPVVTREVQRTFEYQVSVERLGRVAQLLRRAQEEARASQSAFPLPGFSYELLQADMQAMLAGIEPALIPEKRRLRYQTLVPEGPYFQPSLPQEKSDAQP